MNPQETSSDLHSDWEKRILCSDESCIGVIGKDGRCRECGKIYEGELPAAFHRPGSTPDSESAPQQDEQGTPEPEPVIAEDQEDQDRISDDEWEQRKLCSDESCIGVIGKDGRCKECGKPYSG